jgi:hypothetical protein
MSYIVATYSVTWSLGAQPTIPSTEDDITINGLNAPIFLDRQWYGGDQVAGAGYLNFTETLQDVSVYAQQPQPVDQVTAFLPDGSSFTYRPVEYPSLSRDSLGSDATRRGYGQATPAQVNDKAGRRTTAAGSDRGSSPALRHNKMNDKGGRQYQE